MAISLTESIDFLHRLPLFADLTQRQLEVAASLFTFASKKEGELVIRTAAPGDFVYFVLNGYVKICTPRHNEPDLILGIRGAGEVLGEMSIVDAQEKSATVITHTSCDLAWVSSENFWGVLWEFSPVPYNLAHLLNKRLRRLNSTLNALVPYTTELRLARQLLLLATEFGQQTSGDDLVVLPFPLSSSDLAGLTGMPFAEVKEWLHDWQQDGIISSSSNTDSPFIIRDSAALQAIALK